MVTHMVIFRPVKRTVKLCAAISAGSPSETPASHTLARILCEFQYFAHAFAVPYIVTEDWISACESARSIVAADPYLIEGRFESSPAGSALFLSCRLAIIRPMCSGCAMCLLQAHGALMLPYLASERSKACASLVIDS